MKNIGTQEGIIMQLMEKIFRLTAEYPATSDHHCFNVSFYKRIY